jgi:hypothetical protein
MDDDRHPLIGPDEDFPRLNGPTQIQDLDPIPTGRKEDAPDPDLQRRRYRRLPAGLDRANPKGHVLKGWLDPHEKFAPLGRPGRPDARRPGQKNAREHKEADSGRSMEKEHPVPWKRRPRVHG